MKKVVILIAAILMIVNAAYSQGEYYHHKYKAENDKITELNGDIYVKAGNYLTITALNPVNSETAKAGDKVIFYLSDDFYSGKFLIAPQGSRVNGIIISIKSDTVKIRFNNITTPQGQIIPISSEYTITEKAMIKQNTKINIIINQPITVKTNTPY